jgi:HAD superfamily phosphoserine phosphatase-like hydrolase
MTKPFAAFDVDGTIFKSSLAEKIVEHGIADGLFAAEPFNKVHDSRRKWQENNTEGIYQAYLKQLVGALVMQMTNVEVEHFDKVTADMIKEHTVRKFRLPKKMIRALAYSHTPIVISGSPDVLVRPFVADLNIAAVYGSTYDVEDGRFTGLAKSVGNKALLLRDLVEQGVVTREGSVAIGDTYGDVPMLEYASKAVMFNGSRTLIDYGEVFGWDKAFEVKDNITILSKDPESETYAETDIESFLDSLKS